MTFMIVLLGLIWIFSIVAGLALYILPSYIAWRRHHSRLEPLVMLNLLTGLSGIGWVACMVWAVWEPSTGSTDTKQSRLLTEEEELELELSRLPPSDSSIDPNPHLRE